GVVRGGWSECALGTGFSPSELYRAGPSTKPLTGEYMASSNTFPTLRLANANTGWNPPLAKESDWKSPTISPCEVVGSQFKLIGPARVVGAVQVLPPSDEEINPSINLQVETVQFACG